MRRILITKLVVVFTLLGLFSDPNLTFGAEELILTENGKSQVSIVVSPKAGKNIRASADELAQYLERISGTPFRIVEGQGGSGIVLGLPENLPDVPFKTKFGEGPFERDHYRLVSTTESLYLLGATPTAVEFAVWDLLYQFGYRYYFPSDNWEIIPSHRDLRISVDRYERPDFYSRDAPRGGIRHELQPWLKDSWGKWRIRNRTASSFKLKTGHAYDGIIKNNKTEFNKHPEYLALLNGKRGGTKFCISNPGLRELVVQYATSKIEANPEGDSISLDPSDGGGWCECQSCKEMGSVSDRVVLLSNQAAEAVNKLGDTDKYIGIYAYNDYSPSPTVKVHPKVIPSIATAFIKGNQTFDEMLTNWSKKAGMIGVRDYYGLPVWHQSMPGAGKAGRPEILAQTIRDQHAAGVRFINAESDNAWGPNGLGYYLTTRLMWDVETSVNDVYNDFLVNCFGTAKEPMREFYQFIGSGPRYSDHMIGTMYRQLKKARELTTDQHVLRRITDLVLYTRYVELYRNADDQEGFDRVVRFLWRSRKSSMSDSIGMFWYLNRSARRSKSITWIPGKPESRNMPPQRLRDRGDELFSEDEIQAFIEVGIRNHDVLEYTPLEFSEELVPAQAALQLPEVPSMGKAFYGGAEGTTTTRGEVNNYLWVSNPPQDIKLEMATGIIYDSRGPTTVELAWRGTMDVEKVDFHVVETAEIPEDQKWHKVHFTADKKGLYRVSWNERLSGTRVRWPEDLPRMVNSSQGAQKQVTGRHSWYFYVPHGTQLLGAYKQAAAGGLYNADGKQVLDFSETGADYISVEVPVSQAGRLWSVRKLGGRFRLQNIPPYAVGRAQDLLLPKEVLDRERRR